jgi:predicted AAA+ superfamily ATPase
MATLGRFFELPGTSTFLFGPRGTGKSTFLSDALPSALHLNLLLPQLARELRARPERLAERVAGLGPGPHDVVLDEVQRVPELLPVVHALIERGGGHRFVLTGSSARKLRREGTDLLGGRALWRTLHPFMAAELPSFSLERALQTGMLPLVEMSADPADRLRAYAALYLEQEVQAEGLVRDVGGFARFLEAVSLSHATVLTVSNVARETQVSRKTVEGYLSILEDLLLAWRLPVFTRRAQRALVAHPKLYLFDAGVFRSLRPRGPLDVASEIDGAALEGLVAQHLRAWVAYRGDDAALYFWRTRAGSEVDFIVYGAAGFWGIEVKNTHTVRSADLRGLRALRADYPECEPLLLYRGDDPLVVDGIRCLPVEGFLRDVRPSHGLS